MTSRSTIGLLGATGYTGKLTAAELRRRGIRHRLGGRSAERLAALPATELADTVVVDAADPAGLDRFMAGCDAVISCVGPFTRLGWPVVEAAVRNGIPYVDSTGETPFMAMVYAGFPEATSPAVPACGFDYVPGDLAAAIAIESLGVRADVVLVAYRLSGTRISQGTARTMVDQLASADFLPRRADVPWPDGLGAGITFPWGEALTVPQAHPGVRCETVLVTSRLAATTLAGARPLLALSKPFGRVAAPILGRIVDRLPEGPDLAARAGSTFRILAEATAPDGRRSTVVVTGRDPYGLTARFLVEAALRVEGKGGLTLSQAVDPQAFLDAVSGSDLRWELR